MQSTAAPNSTRRVGTSTKVIATLTAALLALGALLTGPVSAVQPGSHDGELVSSTSPANWTPHVLDGEVETIAEVGNTMVIGGNFSQIATAADRNTAIDRPYLFSFQKGSGQINTNFSPDVNGEITALLPTGDGQTVWIAGGFNTLNGETVRNLAKVDLATGQRVTQFDPPALNGRVHDLQLRNGKLYLTGRFTMAGDETRTLLAAVDPTTGALDPEVRADFAEPRRDSHLTINSSDVSPDGTRMVVTGNFTTVNGQGRYQIALLDLTTSPVSVADWQTGLYGDGCSNAFKTYMRDVDFSPDGTSFAVVTTGAYNTTFLCDTAAAWDATATGTNLQPEWVNYSGGDTLTAVAWTDTAIYIGGHQRWANNPYARDRVGAGAVPREGLAALDPRSGATLTWNPGRTRGVAVYSLVATDAGLWIGSDTERIAGFQYRGRLAFMPTDSSTTMPNEFTGTLPGQVVSLGLMQGFFGSVLDRTTTRTFTGTEVTGTPVTAEGTEDWSSLRGSFMIDGKLYTGWSDSTFRVQDYDGTTFGPQSTIPLALVPGDSLSLNRFATEDLSSITGMFYDAATGRLYFTKSGSNSLHYRSFSPESRIVGGQRISSTSGAAGVDWSSVQTMFMVGGRLYTSSTSGNLISRDWDPSTGLPVAGTATTVSGPGTDGQTWWARDAFVLAAEGVLPPNALPVAEFSSSCTGATCQLDASASSDADGTIESYVWNFGDGTSPGAGVLANHTYAVSGTYTVSLTVTDDRGDTATFSQDVTVTVPNQLPVAAFSANCAGLDCTFDSSNSTDPDGTIESYQWDLGDGSTSTDAAPTHTYDEAGSYTVTLTVTDDRGATATSTTGVSVIDPESTPSVVFRAAAGANSNSTSSSLAIPGQVRPGDLMVLFATSNSGVATTTGPAGWTLLDAAASTTTSSQTAAWTKTATAADAGSAVTVSTSGTTKTALQLIAYEGATGVTAHQVALDTTSTNLRTTPTVPVAVPGSAVVSYWADKSSDNTGWALPAEVTGRDTSVGAGGGRIVAALADTAPVGAGTAGGLTASSGSVNRRGHGVVDRGGARHWGTQQRTGRCVLHQLHRTVLLDGRIGVDRCRWHDRVLRLDLRRRHLRIRSRSVQVLRSSRHLRGDPHGDRQRRCDQLHDPADHRGAGSCRQRRLPGRHGHQRQLAAVHRDGARDRPAGRHDGADHHVEQHGGRRQRARGMDAGRWRQRPDDQHPVVPVDPHRHRRRCRLRRHDRGIELVEDGHPAGGLLRHRRHRRPRARVRHRQPQHPHHTRGARRRVGQPAGVVLGRQVRRHEHLGAAAAGGAAGPERGRRRRTHHRCAG